MADSLPAVFTINFLMTTKELSDEETFWWPRNFLMTKKLVDQETFGWPRNLLIRKLFDKDERVILQLFTYFPTNGLLVEIFLRHFQQSVIFHKHDDCENIGVQFCLIARDYDKCGLTAKSKFKKANYKRIEVCVLCWQVGIRAKLENHGMQGMSHEYTDADE